MISFTYLIVVIASVQHKHFINGCPLVLSNNLMWCCLFFNFNVYIQNLSVLDLALPGVKELTRIGNLIQLVTMIVIHRTAAIS